MASSTSTRRVLSDLNVNAPVAAKSVSTPLSKSGSSGSGVLFGEFKMAGQGENAAPAVGFASEKRVISSGSGGLERESASKRRKISGEDADGERGYKVCLFFFCYEFGAADC